MRSALSVALGRDGVADRQLIDQVEHALARLGLLRHSALSAGSGEDEHVDRRAIHEARAGLTIEEVEPRRVDREADRVADADRCARIDACVEQRSAFGEDRRVVLGLEALCADAWRVDGEVHVALRPHLFEHLDVHVDRGGGIRRERRLLEGLWADSEHDVCRARGRPAERVERNAKLAERDVVAVDARLDEVHRRRADEGGDEEVAWLSVERLRRVDLEDPAVTHHCDALSERHRLDLIVRDVDRGHAEPCVELRQRGAHPHAELRVEVGQRLVHEKRLRLPDDRAAHRDPLALTTRQVGRPSVQQLVEPE